MTLLETDSSGQSLTGLAAGELLGEQLCLGRLRGGEYCLPRKELLPLLLPLLRLRPGLLLRELTLLDLCFLLSPLSLLPLRLRSLLLDLLRWCRSDLLLLLSLLLLASLPLQEGVSLSHFISACSALGQRKIACLQALLRQACPGNIPPACRA